MAIREALRGELAVFRLAKNGHLHAGIKKGKNTGCKTAISSRAQENLESVCEVTKHRPKFNAATLVKLIRLSCSTEYTKSMNRSDQEIESKTCSAAYLP